MRNRIKLLWPYIATVLFWIVFLAFVFCFSSCKTKYVSVPEYHTEYITKTDSFTQRDSIFVKDSIYMWMQGDTIYKEKFSVIYKDRWRDRYLCDTVIKTDSVRVPYPVEKKLSKWQQIKLDIGEWVMVALALALIALVVIIVRKILK